MYTRNDIDITDFIKITNAGVTIADFTQIRAALVNRYKSVFGSDIDLSTGSADGIFVNDLALIINNILQAIKTMDASLNVNTAAGVYLDRLCALSNVTRQQPTHSVAWLEVTNTSANKTPSIATLTFIDQAGTEWQADVPVGLTFEANETKMIKAICSEEGAIEANAGWINQTIDVSYLSVNQPEAAIVGSDLETDAELRARRAQSNGAQGTTVLESLAGALLESVAIKDCHIVNNNTAVESVQTDGTTIPSHSIYVILRKRENVSIADKTIGEIIYGKLTPGVWTAECADKTYGTAGEYQYVDNNIRLISTIEQKVFWKVAKPMAPKLTIKFKALDTFTEDEIDSEGGIADSIMNYFNSLPLCTELTQNDVLIQAVYADPQFAGKPTYVVQSATFDLSETSDKDAKTAMTYYNYTKVEKSNVGEVYTLIFS